MPLLLLILAACICTSLGHRTKEEASIHLRDVLANPADTFHSWAVRHHKPYAHAPELLRSGSNDLSLLSVSKEYARRLEMFLSNAHFAQSYNQHPNLGHWLGVAGPHADLTQQEYAQLLGTKPELQTHFQADTSSLIPGFMYETTDTRLLPDTLDWRSKGAVGEVKNQGQCGSCWAFSTTGAIEGANAIFAHKLIELSEQELVDCDKAIDMGCSGGMMNNAYEWIVQNGGLDTEEGYPYNALESPTGCDEAREARHAVTIDGFQVVPAGSELALLQAVAHQPIAVAVEADSLPFQLYAGGVMSDPGCGTKLNHGVLVVGYGGLQSSGLTPSQHMTVSEGEEEEEPYWLVKNSWGPEWGDEGYIRIKMGVTAPTGEQGLCGITTVPSFPVKTKPNPPPTPPVPPPPPPERVQCDETHACPPETTCCCLSEPTMKKQSMVGGCALWGCCPMPNAVCCEDKMHCCPAELPLCDTGSGRCLPGKGTPAFGKGLSIPLIRNQPAEKTEQDDAPQHTLPSFFHFLRKFMGARAAVF